MATTKTPSDRDRRLHDDKGVVVVYVGLLVVALLSFAAIAIDLGQAYSQRRQMQNSADSAAMAGTRAVDQVRFAGALPDTIYTAVNASATSHLQNQTGTTQCWLLDANRNRLTTDVCTSAAAMTAAYNSVAGAPVAGVEVSPSQVRSTYFARVMGFESTTARTSAAATVQPYLGGAGSPFIVCGVPAVSPVPESYPIMDPAGKLLVGVPGPQTNHIPLQGSQQRTCGAGNAFKGKNNNDEILVGVPCTGGGPPYGAPCEMAWGDNGNGFSQNIRDTVAGAVPCPPSGPYDNCDILVPVADWGSGNGNHIDMHVVGWVVMHVTGNGHGNPKYYGDVLAGAVVTGGQGGTGNVTSTTVRVIKLVK